MILDLSFQLLVNGRHLESVNDSSDKSLAQQEAMFELGNVIPGIIWTIALSKDTTTPFMFSKIDLKDGYWRMAVNKTDVWNFAYVLPGAGPHGPIQLVIPDALQKGWSKSPPFSLQPPKQPETCHPTSTTNGKIMMDIDWTTVKKLSDQPASTECDQQKFLSLFKLYNDDFIGVVQSTNKSHLLQFSRRILDGITKVFPPQELSRGAMAQPVLEKKLIEDGIWDTRKEILGWLFDGMARTIKIPHHKCTDFLLELKTIHHYRN
jgi:hypothetical protein